jgi:uncharacterized membrane protein YcaP (DUF421 family)
MTEWPALLRFSMDPLELVLRGSAVYLFVLALFRFVLRRDAGSVSMADMLLLVMIADASQNAMAGGYETLADGAVLVATLAAWNYALDWLSWRFPRARRWIEPPALLMVRNGQLVRRNMRREMVTADEIDAALRKEGVDDIADVKAARMESDGRISVLLREGACKRR